MPLIKKCNVEMYLAARRRKGLHLSQQVAKDGAAGLPVIDSSIEANAAVFVEDFSLEHSSPGGKVSAVVIVTTFADPHVPELFSTPHS